MANTTSSFEIDVDLYVSFKKKCIDEGKSISAKIKELIKKEVENNAKPYFP